MRTQRLIFVSLLWGFCCDQATGQESQAVDLNAQSRENQEKALKDFYVVEKSEEKQEAEPLSGPTLSFSGEYIAVGAGVTHALLKYTGKFGTTTGTDLSHPINTLGYHIIAGFGRALGNGPYIGAEANINITPHANKKKETFSAGFLITSSGLSTVAFGVNARLGYIPATIPCLMFVNLGGIQTKAICTAVSQKYEFSTFRALIGAGAEYKFSKMVGVRCDVNHAFGEKETKTLSKTQSLEGKLSITAVRILVSFYL
ncbi:MAG: hypothetical protein LBH38_04100 [Holosporales bacterium]|nr:hypothetical protein [Holosporales bacterium]